jgi:hypothetical protein
MRYVYSSRFGRTDMLLQFTLLPETLGMFGVATSSRWMGSNVGSLKVASRDADGLLRVTAMPRLMQACTDGR